MKLITIVFLFIVCFVSCALAQPAARNVSAAGMQKVAAAYSISADKDSIALHKLNGVNDYMGLLLQGRALLATQPDMAKNYFQKAVDICQCSDAYNYLAVSFSNPITHVYDSAILVLKLSLAKNPSQPYVCALIGDDYFYEYMVDKANSPLADSAQSYFVRAYSLDSTDIDILKRYANFLITIDACSPMAFNYLTKLQQLSKEDTTTSFYMGGCMLNKGYYTRGLPYLLNAQQRSPNNANYNFALANCYLQIYDYCRANVFIKNAIAVARPDDALLSTYYETLLSSISKCGSVPYDSLLYYLNAGSALPEIAAEKNAVDSINTLIHTFKGGNGTADSLKNLAELNYYAKNYAASIGYLKGLIQIGVEDTDIDVEMVTLLIERGQLNDAQGFIANRLKANFSYGLLYLNAIIELQLHQFDSAKADFTKILNNQSMPEQIDDINKYLNYMNNN